MAGLKLASTAQPDDGHVMHVGKQRTAAPSCGICAAITSGALLWLTGNDQHGVQQYRRPSAASAHIESRVEGEHINLAVVTLLLLKLEASARLAFYVAAF